MTHTEPESVYWCSHCRTMKPRADFYTDAHRNTGVSSRCKRCELIRSRERGETLKRLRDDLKPLLDANPDYRRYIRAAAAQLAA